MHIALGDFGESLHEGIHLFSSKRTVEANAEGLCVHHGNVESLCVLSGEGPASGVNDCA